MFNLVSYFITRNSLRIPSINRYSVIRLSIYEHSLTNCAYIFTYMSSVYMDQQLRVLDDLRTSYNWENSSNLYLLLFEYHTKETALVFKNFRVLYLNNANVLSFQGIWIIYGNQMMLFTLCTASNGYVTNHFTQVQTSYCRWIWSEFFLIIRTRNKN